MWMVFPYMWMASMHLWIDDPSVRFRGGWGGKVGAAGVGDPGGLRASPRPLALKEVLDELGYPTSSGSALMKSLVALGYLDYDRERGPISRPCGSPPGNWVPGVLFGDGPCSPASRTCNTRPARPSSWRCRATCTPSMSRLPSPEPLQLRVPPGTLRPLARSGMELVLLSAKSDAEVERLRRRINASGDDIAQTREELMQR